MILTRPQVNSLQDMTEKYSILELLEFERFCRDNALWDEMHKCFAKDSHVNISWFQGSGSGFVEASKMMKGRAPHKLYNTQTWLNGNKAVSIMLASIQLRDEIDGCPVEINADAKLIFRTQKIDGQWFIAGFDSIYEKDSIIPVYPDNHLSIPAEELSNARESYAGMIYLGKKSGRPINPELPGIDRPDLVEKLYNELDEWLCS